MGHPNCFGGGTKSGYSEIDNAWTYKNGKMMPLSLKAPLGDPLFVSNVQSTKLYRKSNSAQFLFLSPTIATHNGSSSQKWGTLSLKNNEVVLSDTIYQINTSVATNYEDKNTSYPENGWIFKDDTLTKDKFYETLDNYLTEYQFIKKPALWALENPDALFEPEIESVAAIGSLWSKDGQQWNKNALTVFINLWPPEIVLGDVESEPNTAKIEVNGASWSVSSYMLFDNNYVRLRDAATLLSGTAKQFDVMWDTNEQCVRLTTGKAYEGGSSMDTPNSSAVARYSMQAILLDGKGCTFTAYFINGNNYIRLRDIGEYLGFEITWDGVNKVITINA